jgi:hypothetical protein
MAPMAPLPSIFLNSSQQEGFLANISPFLNPANPQFLMNPFALNFQ